MLHDGGFALSAGSDHGDDARFAAAQGALEQREFRLASEETQGM